MSIKEIGCCGAYCKTCKVYVAHACKGCKLGYGPGGRDISKAKCPMKVCCLKNGFNTCADCKDLAACANIQKWYGHKGYKYQKYRQAIEYIKAKGYAVFLKTANKWNNAYGKY